MTEEEKAQVKYDELYNKWMEARSVRDKLGVEYRSAHAKWVKAQAVMDEVRGEVDEAWVDLYSAKDENK